tara:strand:- start:416 stop:1921 length:1506 start_codon:yes stop_codon:yes gene_type:complete
MQKKVLLCILDGWGIGKRNKFNAIYQAKKNNFNRLKKKYGEIKLKASEQHVGLPKGQFGNSEVGHMNIGAGRILLQDLMRIDKAFNKRDFTNNDNIIKIKNNCKRVHLVGLLSDGGVHGHGDHLLKIVDSFLKSDLEIIIHCILDGRDSSPLLGLENLKILDKKTKKNSRVNIASVSGRFYVMDRDNRWDRIEKAYRAIIEGKSNHLNDYLQEIKNSYKNKITDEFFNPSNFNNYKGAKNGDGFFITNFRSDRVREFLTAIFESNFDKFKRHKIIKFYSPLSMVEYSSRLKKFLTPMFRPQKINNSLGEVLSKNGLKQLRIAETEKYAHVTYFFNGGLEDAFEGEERILIPSPRVDTYDKIPEMSAHQVTKKLLDRIKKKTFDFVVCNLANPDMVGHSGDLDATIKAVETVDECLGKIYKECKKHGYSLVVTSDHGNADYMFDNVLKEPVTCHSINPVPFIFCEKGVYTKNSGCLADIAPSIIKILDLKKPKEMFGTSLIK